MCQVTASEIQPIIKKDRVLWQLHSRMIAVIQNLPRRAKIVKDQQAVSHPTTKEQLGELQQQVEVQRGY
eukprot:10314539-Karenia_brevis.AAC.1